jgi:hypothetical protein
MLNMPTKYRNRLLAILKLPPNLPKATLSHRTQSP